MAGETEETETTWGEALKSVDSSEYSGKTAPDTIKGWNDRRKSNNQVISGLVPFVQMIGLFNTREMQRMTSTEDLDVRKIWVTHSGGRDIPGAGPARGRRGAPARHRAGHSRGAFRGRGARPEAGGHRGLVPLHRR